MMIKFLYIYSLTEYEERRGTIETQLALDISNMYRNYSDWGMKAWDTDSFEKHRL